MTPVCWRVVAAALGRRVSAEHLPPVLGDLLEDYAARVERVGRFRAEAWLLREAASLWGAYRPQPRHPEPGRLQRLGALGAAAALRPLFRRLAREPGFTATAVGTLALCVAANLAILAVLDGVVLQPLPFPEPERLVSVFNSYPAAGVPDDGCSVPNYYERRGQLPAFESLSMYREGTSLVGQSGEVRVEPVIRVSPEFFATLGVRPALGRVFLEAETDPDEDGVALVSDRFWRVHLAGRASAVGEPIRVDGAPRIVVGVLPPGFRFLSSEAGLFLPLSTRPDARAERNRHSGTSDMIGRLAHGASLEEAQAQIDAHNQRLEAVNPEGPRMAEAGFHSVVKPLHAYHLAGVEGTLVLTQMGGLFLLLIGAVNLANLMLVRASRRSRERAVRRAIGASRRRVVFEDLAESLLLSLAGGGLGVALGAIGIRLVGGLGAGQLPLGARIGLEPRLALAALAGALLVGTAIGGCVAALGLREDLAPGLGSESRAGTASRSARRLRHAFAAGQVGLAFVLLSGASLLGLSLRNAMAAPPGFRPEGVASGRVVLPLTSYGDRSARLAFAEAVVGALEAEPGVLAVGVATNVPLSGQSNRSAATVRGRRLDPPRGRYSYSVGGEYFEAMGFALSEGRFLSAADSRAGRRVCVVDQAFADDYWPGGGALGHLVFPGPSEGSAEEGFAIVGVVAPARQADLTEDGRQGAVYFPFGHRDDGTLYVVARAAQGAAGAGAALRRAVRRIDPELPVTDLKPMPVRITDSLASRRSPALLTGGFAALALLLTCLGSYGLLSYAVSERRREIGVRMALGARPDQVRRQFLALGSRLLLAGALVGVPGAWACGRALRGVLFGVEALDARLLAACGVVIGVVTLAACLLPSQRAARTEPVKALSS